MQKSSEYKHSGLFLLHKSFNVLPRRDRIFSFCLIMSKISETNALNLMYQVNEERKSLKQKEKMSMKKNLMKCMAATMVMTGVMSMTSFAAGWQQNETGWWYGTNADNTSWSSNTWQWIDGNGDEIAECYYFDANGYLMVNTVTPDGYVVDGNGAWVQDGNVQSKSMTNSSTEGGKQEDRGSNVVTTSCEMPETKSKKKSSSGSSSHSGSNSTASSNTGSNSTSSSSGSKYSSDDLSSFAEECFELINKERTKRGLDELEWDDSIAEACDIRAEELPEKFSHIRPDGTICFTVFDEVGIEMNGEGENIAEGYRTPAAAVKAWMNSSGHRANILDKSWEKSAIGFYYDSDGDGYKYYWVQLFGTK